MLSIDSAFVPVLLRLPLRHPQRRRLRACPKTLAYASSSPASTENDVWRHFVPTDGLLRLQLTLFSGQAFRWRDCGIHQHFVSESSARIICREWAGVIGTRLYVLRQSEQPPPTNDFVWWRVAGAINLSKSGVNSKRSNENEDEAVLHDYFRLSHDTTALMKSFCAADTNFNSVFPFYCGLRTLRTPPVECLFSFICSSNNNIKRISTMVTHLSMAHGTLIATHADHDYYTFPTVEQLSNNCSEEELREAGFGYRARYIPGTATMLHRLAEEKQLSAEELLHSWRSLARKQVAEQLVRFPGIGRKVAGCIALLSLDQLGEIPVDTHVWKIAIRYMPELEQKSLTDRVYERVGNFFRERFGEEYAGLAHNVLFVGELSDFKKLNKREVKGKKRGKKSKAELKGAKEEAFTAVHPKAETNLLAKKEETIVKNEPIEAVEERTKWADISDFTRKRKLRVNTRARKSPRKSTKDGNGPENS